MYKNNLIAENKQLLEIVSMFKNCNATISDLYGKSKNKIAMVFLSKLPWLFI